MASNKDTLVLFDVDGTLTVPRNKVTPDMLETLAELRKKVVIGIVGGSDLAKQREQMGDNVLELFDYVFPENGLVAYKQGQLFHTQRIQDYLGEENLKQLLNFMLHYIADLDIPIKRGTFIEFRNGMINVSPIGRNCSQKERDEFEQYDKVHKVRAKMVEEVQKRFGHLKLKLSIGGQISFDLFPEGWDKTYCLRHVEGENFKEIHFFGDKTHPGGNDYEIYTCPKVKGHSVATYNDTIRIAKELFLKDHQ